MAKKYVYLFGGRATKAEGNADMKAVLGGKGANLAEMTNLGIPVPPGFTISTDMCTVYYETKGLPKDLKTQVKDAIKKVERSMGWVLAIQKLHSSFPFVPGHGRPCRA
jgi:pyruvate,orthophosphate dikinase